MPTESRTAHELPATDHGDTMSPGAGARIPAPSAGWAGAAMAVRAVQLSTTPLLLTLGIAETGTVLIDVRHRAYDGVLPAAQLPVAPASVSIETHPTFPGAPLPFPAPGAELDALLWHIGYHAFPETVAPWMPESARVRLTRWPNLSDMPISLDHVRMTAMLGNGYATAAELAATAGVDLAIARSTLNAFGVVGILRAAPGATPEASAAPAVQPRGLFARLRDRLGF